MTQIWNSPLHPWQTWDGTNHKWKDPSLSWNNTLLPWKADGGAAIATTPNPATILEGANTGTTICALSVVGVYTGTPVFAVTGADAAKVSVDSSTGVVTNAAVADYETLSAWQVIWGVTGISVNAVLTPLTQAFTVSVTNVAAVPVNTVRPAVTGTLNVGDTLTCGTGTWTAVDPVTGYAYQWYYALLDEGEPALVDGLPVSDGSPASGTASTFILTEDDVDNWLLCRVTATNINGSALAYSDADGPASSSSFFLRFIPSLAADQTFADAAKQRTANAGVLDGILQSFNNGSGSSSLGIVSGNLVAVGAAEYSVGSVSVYSRTIPRTKALAYQIKFAATNAAGQLFVGPAYWQDSNGPLDANKLFFNYDLIGGDLPYSGYGNHRDGIASSYTPGGAKELLWLLGGFSSAGVPWNGVADFDDYLYGASMFEIVGATRRLLYRDQKDGFALSAIAQSGGYVDLGLGVTQYDCGWSLSHMIIENKDWSAALAPTFLDTSVALNDTYTATANKILEVVATLPASGNRDISVRYTDDNNRDFIRWDSAGNLTLQERVLGSTTQRASASGITNGTVLRVIMEGNTIKVQSNDAGSFVLVEHFSYGSASSNAAATGVKISDLGTGGSAITYIGSWPRTGYLDFTDCASVSTTGGSNPISGAATKVIGYDGDSIPDDGNAREGIPIDLQVLRGGSTLVTNKAVGGSTIADVTARRAALVALFNGANAQNIAILDVASNDLHHLGNSSATVIADLQAEITALDADLVTASVANRKIAWCSILDRTQTADAISVPEFAIRRAAVNSAMATWLPANGHIYVNRDSDARLTDSSNTVYFRTDPAGVHPTWTGCGVASVVTDAALTAAGLPR